MVCMPRFLAWPDTLANTRSLEHVFVIGALIHILKASPPADVVDKQSGEIYPLAFHVRHQLIEALAASNVQTTSSVIRVFLNNFHIVRGSVLTDHLQLIFRRILLVLSRHAHVLRCAHGKRRVCGRSGRLHWFATNSCRIEIPR